MPKVDSKVADIRARMMKNHGISERDVLNAPMRSEGNGQVACCNGNDEEQPK